MKINKPLSIFLISILAYLALSLHALAHDHQALMHIIADNSQYNYKNGENWFNGHVKINQGNTHLIADRLITKKNAKNRIHEIIALGLQQPVHYWTYPRKGEKILHAYAKVMKFYPLESRIVLEGNVLLTQGENRFQGQIIVYNIKQQTIIVPPVKNSQASFVIEANPIKKTLWP